MKPIITAIITTLAALTLAPNMANADSFDELSDAYKLMYDQAEILNYRTFSCKEEIEMENASPNSISMLEMADMGQCQRLPKIYNVVVNSINKVNALAAKPVIYPPYSEDIKNRYESQPYARSTLKRAQEVYNLYQSIK